MVVSAFRKRASGTVQADGCIASVSRRGDAGRERIALSDPTSLRVSAGAVAMSGTPGCAITTTAVGGPHRHLRARLMFRCLGRLI